MNLNYTSSSCWQIEFDDIRKSEQEKILTNFIPPESNYIQLCQKGMEKPQIAIFVFKVDVRLLAQKKRSFHMVTFKLKKVIKNTWKLDIAVKNIRAACEEKFKKFFHFDLLLKIGACVDMHLTDERWNL
jgi:hypothetical protein